MADKDTQLELKKRARRRLVGAIALAVLAAVVLPMVMDQEPRPVSQDIQIRIPSQDAGAFTSRILPGKSAAPTPLPEAPAQPKSAESKPPAPAADKPAAAQPAPSKPADGAERASPKPAEAAPAKAAEPAADKSAEKAKPQAEAARAQAILEGQSEQFVVQLGVFSERENARKVQARVKAEGYNSFSEPMETAKGVQTRVRAGPFASREAAEKARDKLKRSGLNGIVAPKT